MEPNRDRLADLDLPPEVPDDPRTHHRKLQRKARMLSAAEVRRLKATDPVYARGLQRAKALVGGCRRAGLGETQTVGLLGAVAGLTADGQRPEPLTLSLDDLMGELICKVRTLQLHRILKAHGVEDKRKSLLIVRAFLDVVKARRAKRRVSIDTLLRRAGVTDPAQARCALEVIDTMTPQASEPMSAAELEGATR